MPTYYPVFIDVKGRNCIIIGGGNIGEEKVHKLLDCEAKITVISPEVNADVQELVDNDRLFWHQREYRQGDLEGAFIAIASTDNNDVNRQIAKEAEERNVLLNVVDVTHLCTFIAPAVARRGDVTIAASTGGTSPALARKFRELLNGSSIEAGHALMDYAELAPLLADARAEIREKGITLLTDHWQACITDNLVDMVMDGKYGEAREIVMTDLMKGTTCDCSDGVCKMWEEKKELVMARDADKNSADYQTPSNKTRV